MSPGHPISSELYTLQADGHWLDMFFLTTNNSKMTVLQTLVTEKQAPLELAHLQ